MATTSVYLLEKFSGDGLHSYLDGLPLQCTTRVSDGAMVAHVQHTHLSPLRTESESQPDLKWKSWYLLADGLQFTVQNLDQFYVLVFSALPTTHSNTTSTVLKEI